MCESLLHHQATAFNHVIVLSITLFLKVMDGEAWHAAVHGVTKSRTQLSNWTELNYCLIAYTILSTWFTHLTWNKVTAHSAQLKGLLASWLATGLPISVQLAKNKHISLTITRVLTSSLCSFLFYIRKPLSALLFNFLLVILASSSKISNFLK